MTASVSSTTGGTLLAVVLLVEGVAAPVPSYLAVLVLSLAAATALVTLRTSAPTPGRAALALTAATTPAGVLLAGVTGVPGTAVGAGVPPAEALLVGLLGLATLGLVVTGRPGTPSRPGVVPSPRDVHGLSCGGWPPECCSSRTTT